MTIRILLVSVVVALALGAIGGYRYADARCAAGKLAAVENALAEAGKRIEQANLAASEAGKKEAALADRQTKERVKYVQVIKEVVREVPIATDCRVPDASFRLLVDAVRAANAGSARTH
jgi:hypothetical protein